MALSLVTQYDIDRLKNIEHHISEYRHMAQLYSVAVSFVHDNDGNAYFFSLSEITLSEYEVKESEALKLLSSVNIAKREVEIVS